MDPRFLHIWLLLYPGRMHAWQIIRGISNVARHRKWILSIHEPHLITHDEYRHIACDGVIGLLQSADDRRVLRERGIPAVNVSRVDPPYDTPCVVVNDRACGRLAAEHLLERGFVNFAYLGHRDAPYSRERGGGFAEAIRATGLPHHFDWLDGSAFDSFEPRGADGRWADERSAASRYAWLLALPRPVGLFVSLDGYAMSAAEACHAVGLDVPRDVAILGVHNGQILCEMCTPPLSSVATPVEQMGEFAADLLDRQFRGERVSHEPIELPPIGIVPRGSTDVVSVDDELVVRAIRYMRAHAHERIDVSIVAQDLVVSRRHLERRFRATLGRSPLQELQRMRTRLAMSRLATSDDAIGDVARQCGYSRSDQLARAVRDATGRSPRQYREQFRGGVTAAGPGAGGRDGGAAS